MSSSIGSIGGVPALPNIDSSSDKKLSIAEDQLQRAYLQVQLLETKVTDPKVMAMLDQSMQAIRAKFDQIVAIRRQVNADSLSGSLVNDAQALETIFDQVNQVCANAAQIVNGIRDLNIMRDAQIAIDTDNNIIASKCLPVQDYLSGLIPMISDPDIQHIVFNIQNNVLIVNDPTKSFESRTIALSVAQSQLTELLQNPISNDSTVYNTLNTALTMLRDPSLINSFISIDFQTRILNSVGSDYNQLLQDPEVGPLLNGAGAGPWSPYWTLSDYNNMLSSFNNVYSQLSEQYNVLSSNYLSAKNHYLSDLSSYNKLSELEKTLFKELYPDAAAVLASPPSTGDLPPFPSL